MSEISYYESRPGKLSCSPEEAFTFITDLRNFKRFVREGAISNWNAERESCSFSASMIGTVKVRLTDKEAGKKVVFQGDALSKNDFTINVDLSGNSPETAELKLSLSASLNPFMKMMAEKPIRQFLDMLIKEIEAFREWNDITG
jgi:carbon monoxide dehydrogenase subunit G